MSAAGYQMVPRAGLLACEDSHDRLGLLWLCERANVFGWGVPFECRNVALATGAGKGKGWVRGFLRRMEAVGVLEVTDPGSKTRPRSVALADPAGVIHKRDHKRDHNSHPATGNNQASDSQADPRAASYGSRNRNRDRIDPMSDSVQAVWEANRKHHPRRGKKPPASDAKHIRARLAESDLDACLLVAEWAHSPGSWWLANDRLGIGTLYKADKWSDRLEQAETWAAGGRKGKAPAAPSTDLLAFLYARRSGCPAEKFKADTAAEGLDPAALMAALDAVGFSSRADLNRLPSARWAFVSRDLRAAYDRLTGAA